ncbi:MAG: methyltransferase domain-containing protein [Candidatus Omnitrophota bacterium]
MALQIFSLLEKQIAKCRFIYLPLKKVKVFIQKTAYYLLKLTGKDRNHIYDDQFFNHNLKTNIPIAKDLVDILYNYFHPESVVDVGCGTAEYLAEFNRLGIKIKGYEGSPAALKKAMVSGNFIQLADLREKIKSDERYDLALCLEVAEHIESRYSKILVDNLASLSDTIIFSAAIPGQGGHFHINEQPHEFWIGLWQERNYILRKDIIEALKEQMRERGILWWYTANLMVFLKSE